MTGSRRRGICVYNANSIFGRSHTLEARIVDLEIRLAHQEAAIEALTVSDLAKQRELERVQAELERIKGLLRDLSPAAVVSQDQETPPPHY